MDKTKVYTILDRYEKLNPHIQGKIDRGEIEGIRVGNYTDKEGTFIDHTKKGKQLVLRVNYKNYKITREDLIKEVSLEDLEEIMLDVDYEVVFDG